MKGRKNHNRASGGKAPQLVSGNTDVVGPAKDNTSKNPGPVAKKIGRMAGGGVAARGDRPNRRLGGAIGRPGRARGGATSGSNNSPLSSAAKAI